MLVLCAVAFALCLSAVTVAEDDVQVRVRFPDEPGRSRRYEPDPFFQHDLHWHHHHHHNHHHHDHDGDEEGQATIDLRSSVGNLTEVSIAISQSVPRNPLVSFETALQIFACNYY